MSWAKIPSEVLGCKDRASRRDVERELSGLLVRFTGKSQKSCRRNPDFQMLGESGSLLDLFVMQPEAPSASSEGFPGHPRKNLRNKCLPCSCASPYPSLCCDAEVQGCGLSLLSGSGLLACSSSRWHTQFPRCPGLRYHGGLAINKVTAVAEWYSSGWGVSEALAEPD